MNTAIQSTQRRDPLFLGLGDNPHARLRLFCFSFAGGGPSVYQAWLDWLPSEVELVRVQLPNRGIGGEETEVLDIVQMANELALSLAADLDLPYVLFGYSMGALLAYEMTVHLLAQGRCPPSLFCAAACRPPDQQGLPSSQMSTQELSDYLQGLDPDFVGGAVARQMLQQNLSNTRADLSACERYVCSHWRSLECPVSTYCADQDPLARPDQMALWQRYTEASCIHHLIRGGHFFLLSQGRRSLQQLLLRELDNCLIKHQ